MCSSDLREQGVDEEVCDLLDAKATEVYTACSFQDLTGQRTRKVIGVLRYLEDRINAMIEIWGLDGTLAAEAAEQRAVDASKALLNGPARPGHGLDQADVDMVMGPAAVSYSEDIPPIELEGKAIVELPAENAVIDVAMHNAAELPVYEELAVIASDEIKDADFVPVEAPQPKPRAASASDPLESFMALSAEEKIALFT